MNKNIVKLIAILVMCFMLVSVLVACKGETGATGPQGPAGLQGKTGPAGADGKTPVRGVDYWTDADKQEMVGSVLAALPKWTGGSF